MKGLINGLLVVCRWILFFAAFGITFYIILSMYDRVGKSLIEAIDLFIPYFLLLILFMIDIFMKKAPVNKNIFYNLTCCLAFTTIVIIGLRAIYDKNMVLNEIMGYGINFSYFSDFLSFMQILLYGLSLANILFLFHVKDKKLPIQKKKPIAHKISDIEVI